MTDASSEMRKRKRYAYRILTDESSSSHAPSAEDGSVQDSRMLRHAGSIWDAEERRRAGKMSSSATAAMSSVPPGEELWLVSIPADFDAHDLNGLRLSGKKPLADQEIQIGATHTLTADLLSGSSQVRCLRPTSSYVNGLRLTPPAARVFHVVERDAADDEASEAGGSAQEEEERLRKAEEVVKRLLPKPREQIEFRTFSMADKEELLKRMQKAKARGEKKRGRNAIKEEAEDEEDKEEEKLVAKTAKKDKKKGKKEKEKRRKSVA
eukprot:CAMPEP_0171498700 /NCGR_PEP_ID=MMETSP0958-20121227/8000_1 /TAXON_ID=87120 /ORGANISM="Aurantiochytrium limacinum, Strain ATCCMYA-1381" /LENGTH=265 /DNA_ID=CAMNT_0012033137 /DNA_START=127 /DNA_END=924 /DNA_ORIENTATION=+